MIFDRNKTSTNRIRLNMLSRELTYLKCTFADNGRMIRHLSIALAELEMASEYLKDEAKKRAETKKIKKDFE